ncbi:[LSU ribosomal protein L11P]-lysine N-methyltransferase [Maribacter vaceletii]|uniref:Ribosomal protein L11 methyltransferase n=1 Tax=Maribacter vaceletii TaxID=1206816 RepID=A0A495E6T1_9FLAO|nr:50S ribosomal protein L11 methyltransferase [Maribacter vaceletii]RKR12391.1 [LSU ribosomal protein L11P]-lysine N-methyltransferase [Maribacter vaceletii]
MANIIYIEYAFTVFPVQPTSDILIAELGEIGFESFVENENGVLAYIQKTDWQESIVDGIAILENENFKIEYKVKEIEQENWNATWEENFKPIQVGDACVVRAPFHDAPKVDYDIVIEPKMSFGTGHHETTFMMLKHILENDFTGKSVLDMGSGTGVLAILAAMKGAAPVEAIDIDNWCYLNAKENVERNGFPNIKVLEGDASLLRGKKFDVIIANINRNILVADIPIYAKCLNAGASLFLSGFYLEDLDMITSKCGEYSLKFEKNLEKNNWVAAKYVF